MENKEKEWDEIVLHLLKNFRYFLEGIERKTTREVALYQFPSAR